MSTVHALPTPPADYVDELTTTEPPSMSPGAHHKHSPIEFESRDSAAPLVDPSSSRERHSTSKRHSMSSSKSFGKMPSSSTSTRRRSSTRRHSVDANGSGEGTAGAGSQYKPRHPLQPPRAPDLYHTDEEWRVQHSAEQRGSLHNLPLILVALPPLGAIIHGRAENWSDALILIMCCFYLYHLIKAPWDIYYASHGRVVLAGSESRPGEEGYDPDLAAKRDRSIRVLRRAELTSLLATMLVPAAGSYLLVYVRQLLSDPDRYINRSIISLFAIATAVKPLLHFAKLVKNNSLYHQEQVWYPNTEVHLLRRRVEALEKDLSQLTRAFATKDDVRTLRDGVDVPLTQLSKAVRRFDRKEEYLRLSSEQRFAVLDAKLEETTRDLYDARNVIEDLRYQHEQALASPLAQLVNVMRYAIGQASRGPFFWLLLPVTGPAKAIEFVTHTVKDDASSSPPKARPAYPIAASPSGSGGSSATSTLAAEYDDKFGGTMASSHRPLIRRASSRA
ncbi:hypothetical protein OIO90_000572 [Microbotryomycetes sp. JL221]|nr:hypothetical protein OIO90_000572 [Microbotryomycetes sp. JL221]